MKRKCEFLIFSILGGALLAPGMGAQAQTGVIEEILVTAQKREESIQDVPMSISAYTGDMLKSIGGDTVVELQAQVPNLNVGSPLGEMNVPNLSIRGVGISDWADTQESPVSMYIDGIYVGSLAGQTINLFDLERVEVLRGPQGTLYGRNTTGGIVHFISKRPTSEFEAGISGEIGEFSTTAVEAYISGPISDSASARLSLLKRDSDGYVEDRLSGDMGNATDVIAVRGQLQFEMSDQWSMLLNVHGNDADNTGNPFVHQGRVRADGVTPCSNDEILSFACFDAFGYRDADGGDDFFEGDYSKIPPIEVRTKGGFVQIDYENGPWSITSISAIESTEKEYEEDSDSSPTLIIADTEIDVDADQFTQELRFSHSTETTNWVAGAYFIEDDKEGSVALLLLPETPGGFSYLSAYEQETSAWAIFGQFDHDFANNFGISVGLRYSDESKDFDNTASLTLLANDVTVPLVDVEHSASFSNVSGSVTANWTPAPGQLVYASYSRGFKSGGFNGGLVFSPIEVEPFVEEILTAYEVGFKSLFFDNRVRLSAAGFFYDYEDLQTFTQISGAGGLPATVLTNAADAEIGGFEAELLMRPTHNWDLRLGLAYLDTELVDFVSFSGFDMGGNPLFADNSGNDLVYAPKLTFNALTSYRWELAGGSSLTAQVDLDYTDDFFFDTANEATQKGESVTIVNARLDWESPGGEFRVGAFIRNLTDQEYTVEGFLCAACQSNVLIQGSPSYVGVNLAYTLR